jgi:iron complex transport system ATP-binding protein
MVSAAAADATTAVAMRGASVVIGGGSVLGPLDFLVQTHEHWVLLGPNGSGKTTLLALAGARRQPSFGTVTVLGVRLGQGDIRSLHPRISHTSHLLTEMMPPSMSVEEVVLTGKGSTLATWFQEYGDRDLNRAKSLLGELGCSHLLGRTIANASQGERQRVLLARALFSEPELLILDEPAAGLDFPGREGLLSAIEAIIGEPPAPTSIIATHHLEEIPPSTTHAALLRAGRLVAAGTVEEALTEEHLRSCFGLPVRVERDAGRWWARAATSNR